MGKPTGRWPRPTLGHSPTRTKLAWPWFVAGTPSYRKPLTCTRGRYSHIPSTCTLGWDKYFPLNFSARMSSASTGHGLCACCPTSPPTQFFSEWQLINHSLASCMGRRMVGTARLILAAQSFISVNSQTFSPDWIWGPVARWCLLSEWRGAGAGQLLHEQSRFHNKNHD